MSRTSPSEYADQSSNGTGQKHIANQLNAVAAPVASSSTTKAPVSLASSSKKRKSYQSGVEDHLPNNSVPSVHPSSAIPSTSTGNSDPQEIPATTNDNLVASFTPQPSIFSAVSVNSPLHNPVVFPSSKDNGSIAPINILPNSPPSTTPAQKYVFSIMCSIVCKG